MTWEHVYIAAPYSSDPNGCTHIALKIASELLDNGYKPFVPHLCHFWDLLHPCSYEEWTAYVASWVPKCDVLVRFIGESKGADAEVNLARSLNVPVVYIDRIMGIADLLAEEERKEA